MLYAVERSLASRNKREERSFFLTEPTEFTEEFN
jgi:hypothetical protein